jgi:hypothetical protein
MVDDHESAFMCSSCIAILGLPQPLENEISFTIIIIPSDEQATSISCSSESI